jgi:hypothetical protein
MVSSIARFFLYLTLGWVLYEIILESNKLFALSLNPYLGIVPALLIYIIQEYGIRKWKTRGKIITVDEPIESKKRDIFSMIIWSLVLCILLSVVILIWLGLIYKQTVKGLDVYD